jgi:hypothetical protein
MKLLSALQKLFSLQLFFFAVSLLSSSAHAVRLEQPYTVDVPVANQGMAERQAAESAGLLRVLERLSGQSLDKNAVVKRATANAEKYLQRFSYVQDKPVQDKPVQDKPPAPAVSPPDATAVPPAPAAQPPVWRIRLVFVPDSVNRLLEESGVALWPLDRPQVMLLMVNEQASLLPLPTADGSDAIAPLQAMGLARGIPLLVPDPAAQDVTVAAAVQGMDVASLQGQMTSMKTDALLLGNVRGSDEKGWSGQWLLQSQVLTPVPAPAPTVAADQPAPGKPAPSEQRFQSKGATMSALLDDALRQAAGVLSGGYRISSSTDSGPAKLRLQVDGVKSYAAFTRLRQYLEKLEAVQKIESTQITGTSVIVDLDVKGRDSFRNLVSLFKSLQWQEEIAPVQGGDPSQRVVWRYQWQD